MTNHALERGQILGDYTLQRQLAVGGMAQVWSAMGPLPNGIIGPVALKVMEPSRDGDVEYIKMFMDELGIVQRLRHANIVTVYGGEEVDGFYLQAMELIEGVDLRQVLAFLSERKKSFPLGLLLLIGRNLARALGYVHLRKDSVGRPLNVIHRDISPHNVMLSCTGDIKLLDFGIAKAADRLAKTNVGTVKGKAGYMSPEQTCGDQLGPRSDIFSLGIVLWEAFAGERLFRAKTDLETMYRVQRAQVPKLDDLQRRPDLPPEVVELIHQMMARLSHQRPKSMIEIERKLSRVMMRHCEPIECSTEALASWLTPVVRAFTTDDTGILGPTTRVSSALQN